MKCKEAAYMIKDCGKQCVVYPSYSNCFGLSWEPELHQYEGLTRAWRCRKCGNMVGIYKNMITNKFGTVHLTDTEDDEN